MVPCKIIFYQRKPDGGDEGAFKGALRGGLMEKKIPRGGGVAIRGHRRGEKKYKNGSSLGDLRTRRLTGTTARPDPERIKKRRISERGEDERTDVIKVMQMRGSEKQTK